jgi:isoleucyl-tRNA synthetase
MTQYDADFYKQTVFLPKTDFPMRGGLPQKEPEILKFWDDIDLYETLRKQSANLPRYVLHDGPPYANGNIHIGHAVNKILKDVINKTKQMQGFNADYVPGWDCHGLPIEWKIEEKYRENGQDKDDVDIIEFRKECRDFAQHWVGVQSDEFQRLGVIGNWEKPYLTMRYEAESIIASEIHKFAMNGGLYRGVKTVMWSPVEETALAEAEIEYKEHKSVTIWVRFPVVEATHPALEGADCVIWTTTPWTIPSNRAMAVNKDLDYAVFTVEEVAEGSTAQVGDRLVFAVNLVESITVQAKITKYSQGEIIKGSDIAGTICAHPLAGQGYDHRVSILDAPYVTDEAGTGIVHIAAAHGEEDYDLVMAYNADKDDADKVEITDNVADDGTFRDHVPLFAGMAIIDKDGKFSDGNFAPLKAMMEAGKLLAKGSQRHDYPHSWRSKAPIMYRAVPQWFISMKTNNLRSKALNAIAETNWVPAKGETRIRSMVENRPDWNISRQRAWGVPIAIFVNKATDEILRDEAVNARIADIFTAEGCDAWWSRPASDFLGDNYNADDFEQIFDIVDVWFESGSTHSFVLENGDWGLPTPADLYLEGSDQHRGWFHSSLLESCGTRGHAPYKNVLTHGFTLDKDGRKMSKSEGNTVAPQEMIDKYGADILRLWMVLSDYEEDHRIGDEILKGSADVYRRVRNTFRFLLGALDGFTQSESVSDVWDAPEKLPELEQLVLHQLYELDQKIQKNIAAYDFGAIAKDLYDFCNLNLSAFYFDIRKDRLYCDRPDSYERRATRTVLGVIYNSLTTWFAPVLSFTAEEAWNHRPEGVFGDTKSIHLRTFPDVPLTWKNDAIADKFEILAKIRDAVLLALEPKRADKTIGSSLEAHPVVTLPAAMKQAVEGVDLAELCITSQVTVKEGAALSVEFGLAEGSKCERCWKILPEVGTDTEFPNLTLRDADAVRWYLENDKVKAA